MHVLGGGYVVVWHYIANGRITVRVSQSAKGAEATLLPAGAEAVYKPEDKTLWFPNNSYGLSPLDRGYILHECTHALRDIMAGFNQKSDGLYGSKIAGQLRRDNEAAAYIAGSLFYFYDNAAEWPPKGERVFSVANSIARKIKDQKGARVDETDFSQLGQLISLHPVYAREWLSPDEADTAKGGF
jgi:hypothetical protein